MVSHRWRHSEEFRIEVYDKMILEDNISIIEMPGWVFKGRDGLAAIVELAIKVVPSSRISKFPSTYFSKYP